MPHLRNRDGLAIQDRREIHDGLGRAAVVAAAPGTIGNRAEEDRPKI